MDEGEALTHCRKWLLKKWALIILVIAVNLGCIVVVAIAPYPGGVVVIVTVVSLSHLRDVFMMLISVISLLLSKCLKRRFGWGKKEVTSDLEYFAIAVCVTCYKEPIADVLLTLASSYDRTQGFADNCRIVCVCVCDSPESSVGLQLSEHIDFSEKEDVVYESWLKKPVSAVIRFGMFKENPVVLIQKSVNMGKKDSLLLVEQVVADMSNNLRAADFLLRNNIPKFKYIFNVDADTVLGPDCILKVAIEMNAYQEVDACVCLLHVLPSCEFPLFWDHMQRYQYFAGQYLRRTAESVSGKVWCLSGAGNLRRLSSANCVLQRKNIRYFQYKYRFLMLFPK